MTRSHAMSGLVLIVAAASFAGGCEPDNQCPDDTTSLPVQTTNGSTRDSEFVCIPNDQSGSGGGASPAPTQTGTIAGPDPSATPTGDDDDAGTPANPASDAGSTDDAAASGPICVAPGAVGQLDVHVLTRTGQPTHFPRGAAPDGVYVLAQATWNADDAGAPPLETLRAELAITGAKVMLSAATNGDASSAQSATAALAAGTLTTICLAGSGTAAQTLFPSTPGATEHATISWDGTALTLRLDLPNGTLELAFFPE